MFSKIDNPIGLDISDLSVKTTQLNKSKSGDLGLSAYGDVLLPAGLIEHDEIKDEKALAEFLKNTMLEISKHKGRFTSRSVVASIPESKAFVRVVNFKNLQPEELKTAVPLEAEQYIPISLDEAEIDWSLISHEGNNLQVLIAATPKKYVEKLAKVIKMAGLIPQAFEMESMAIARCLIPQDQKNPGTLILDLDAARTSLIVYANNSIQFTSSMPVAGNAITSSIAQRLEVDTDEAEHLKRVHGIPIHDSSGARVSSEIKEDMAEVTKAVEPVLQNFYDEIKNTIKFHESHDEADGLGSDSIKQILLCGGTAKLPNLPEYIDKKIKSDPQFSGQKITVSRGDAWHNIFKHTSPPFSQREALSYATSLGLSLRNYLD